MWKLTFSVLETVEEVAALTQQSASTIPIALGPTMLTMMKGVMIVMDGEGIELSDRNVDLDRCRRGLEMVWRSWWRRTEKDEES